MAIATVMVVTSMSSVHNRSMQACAAEVNSMVAKCRINSLSRAGDVWLKISQESDGIYAAYYENGVELDVVKAGKKILNGSFTDSNGTSHSLDSTGPLYISFYKGTGKLRTVQDSAAIAGASSSISTYSEEIVISFADNSRSVIIIPETGKHYLG